MKFYKTKIVEEVKVIPFSKEEFKSNLLKYKPKEIFHSYYSRSVACYFVTEYKENSVMIYANSWADKTPKEKSFDKLFREFEIQGLELFYFEPNKEPAAQESDTTNDK